MRRAVLHMLFAVVAAVAPRAGRCESSAGAADSSAHAGMDHAAMDHDMAGMDMHEHAMTGVYGAYPMTREASGTSWQPDAARHAGVHAVRGAWRLMFHGYADALYDDQR